MDVDRPAANGIAAKSVASEIRAWFPIIFAILIPGLVWGLKLEINDDRNRHEATNQALRISKLEALTDRGILPLAQERISALERQVHRLEESCQKPAQ